MIGAAIGDALGKQNEGLTREAINKSGRVEIYGKAHEGTPVERLRPGDYTDDTEQMLILTESLIACNGFNADDFAKRLAKWGKIAMNDPVRRSFVGPSSAIAIGRLNSGSGWKESGSDIPSCGSSMRVAPIGLFYDELDDVESNAALSSMPTHNSKSAIAGAVAVAIAVRCALMEMDCVEIITQTCERASKYDTALAAKIKKSFEIRNNDPDNVFSELGTSYFVYDTVPCAFYCFSRHFNENEKAVIEAVNAGGDTDSIGCITGALCGARNGISSFPDKWIAGLENKELIEKSAFMIYDKKYSEKTCDKFIY